MKIGYNGQEYEIPKPQQFSISEIEIAKTERTIDGSLTKDVIAVKKKFQLHYKGLPAGSFNLFRGCHETGEVISFFFEEAGQTYEISCYITEINRQLYVQNPNLVQGVVITMEEV